MCSGRWTSSWQGKSLCLFVDVDFGLQIIGSYIPVWTSLLMHTWPALSQGH